MKKTFIVWISMFLLFVVLAIILKSVSNSKNKYLLSLDLYIECIVVKKNELNFGHDYGIVYVDIKESNVKGYKKIKDIGVFSDKKAVLIVNNISKIRENDFLFLEKDVIKIYRDNKLVHKNYLDIANFIAHYEIESKLSRSKEWISLVFHDSDSICE